MVYNKRKNKTLPTRFSQRQREKKKPQSKLSESHNISELNESLSTFFTSTPLTPQQKLPLEYDNLMEVITNNIKQQLEELFLIAMARREKELQELKDANLAIEKQLEEQKRLNINLREDVVILKDKIEKIDRKMNDQNGKTEHLIQETYKNVCVLSGQNLPAHVDNENCEQIVAKLLRNKLKVNLPNGSIMNASRLGQKKDGRIDKRSIRFEVNDEKERSDLISTCIKVKPGFYLNEYITKHNWALLKRALEVKKKEKIISTCYVKGGTLSVKRTKDSRPTKILTIQDLDDFLEITRVRT